MRIVEVIGSVTLGKGLVQTIAPLPDGGELFVTWSRVLAPRGWPLQGLGVLPQVCTRPLPSVALPTTTARPRSASAALRISAALAVRPSTITTTGRSSAS